jgi:hypothetical protein
VVTGGLVVVHDSSPLIAASDHQINLTTEKPAVPDSPFDADVI